MLLSTMANAKSTVGVGIENEVTTYKTEDTSSKTYPQLSLGYELELTDLFSVQTKAVVSKRTRAEFNYMLQISNNVVGIAGINLNLIDGTGSGMEAGLLFYDKIQIQYTKVNSAFELKDAKYSSDILSLSYNIGF